MAKTATNALKLTDDLIVSKIYFLRDEKVMLDRDLAELYGVSTRTLNQAVKRNIERFPSDFMFQLSNSEFESLRSQIVILEKENESENLISQNAISNWGGVRKNPYAFTEQGVAMLSSVLKSPTAVKVNIQIIRIFTRMRKMLLAHGELMLKLEKMEKDVSENKGDIKVIFDYLKELLNPLQPERTKIGFKVSSNEKKKTESKRQAKNNLNKKTKANT